jgi:hypothetical protein
MGSRGFSPSALFANGEEGAWYDPSDLSSMKQLSDGTVDAVVDQPVGYIEDKSGNGNHIIQATSTKRPVLRESSGLYYLEFDGIDDGMRTGSNIPFGTNSVTAMSVFTAAEKEASGSNQNFAELSNNIGSSSGGFRLLCTTGDLLRSLHKGTSADTIDSGAVANPFKSVMSSVASISAPSHSFRSNGSSVGSNTNSLGTGTYGDHQLSIGSRAGGNSMNLTGKIYGTIVRGAISTAEEIADVEKYLAAKSGVTL